MINELFIRDYFKQLAETNVVIAHTEETKSFYVLRGMDLDEFDAALANLAGERGLILETGEGNFGSDDNVQDHLQVRLYFVQHTDGSYEQIDQARQDCKMLAAQFMACLRYDLKQRFDREDNMDGILFQQKLKFNTSGSYMNLTALGEDERWHGKVVTLNMHGIGETDMVYNPNHWRAI